MSHFSTGSSNFIKQFFSRQSTNGVAKKPLYFGLVIIVLFFGVFLSWSFLAPIDSASIAEGYVVLDFNRKTIQHLEGGIVDKILVQEGEPVVTGQPLVILSGISAKSQNELLRKQYWTAIAQKERLKAEGQNWAQPQFSALKQQIENEQTSQEIISTQMALFDSRRLATLGKVELLNNQKLQGEQAVSGLRAQLQATRQQLKFAVQELRLIEKLIRSDNG